ncbi:hypothetical protein [Haladaptatus sp. GCM10025893]|uniref:hypothetical protein n=1 Tax=Haladaptatus sp. GCM10025893 TaxID=3252659 RepID=UPI00360AB1E4
MKRAAEPGTTVDVEFENHTHATLRFDGSPDDGMFSVLDVGETTNAVAIESNRDSLAAMYHPFIESFLDVVAGERDDTDRLLDAATLQLAVEATIDTGDAITPESEALAAISVDSAPFLADYNPYY